MSDTVVITVANANSLIGESRTNPWPGIRKVLQAATPPADGIESVMFTFSFMEDQPTVFTNVLVLGSEAEPCAGGSACTTTNTVDSAVSAPWTDEGPTADDCVRTSDREVLLYAREGRGRAADVCQEAQVNDEGPVERLLQWVAGICGGSGHACAEAQIMANNPYVHQNGLVHWLLR